jgi:precorrin-6A/cobalt-precorrin-6A reductase
MKRVVWLVAGTSEGRKLAAELARMGVLVYVSVVTAYGASLLMEHENIIVLQKRLDYEDMCAFLRLHEPELVVDATHPYATEVTENLKKACSQAKCEYLRVVRPESKYPRQAILVQSFPEAVELLSHTKGSIFLTTGSKDLPVFAQLPDYQARIALRILPSQASLQKALELGFKPERIVCMQGPFTKDLNQAMFRHFGASYVVTKDSGSAGGFADKLEACLEVGAELIVIGRPEETGQGFKAVLEILKNRFTDKGDCHAGD